MEEIVISIPDELSEEISCWKKENEIKVDDIDFYQYLIKLGLSVVNEQLSKCNDNTKKSEWS